MTKRVTKADLQEKLREAKEINNEWSKRNQDFRRRIERLEKELAIRTMSITTGYALARKVITQLNEED